MVSTCMQTIPVETLVETLVEKLVDATEPEPPSPSPSPPPPPQRGRHSTDDDHHHQHGAHRSAHHGAQRLPTSDSPRSAARTPRWLRSAQRVLRPIFKLARNALLAPYEIFTLLLQVMTSDGL